MDWVIDEFSSLSLGDKRLEARGKKLLSQLSGNPTGSIAMACSTAADMKAAYRFFNHDRVTPESIQEIHTASTLRRMSEHKIVLIPQDTTVLSFTGQKKRQDAGPTVRDESKGIYLHAALAITPEKVCLGVLSVKQWYREKLQRLARSERQRKNSATPIKEKETYRWLEALQQANVYAQELPDTTVVSIADREGDIYELYSQVEQSSAEKNRAHYLIRARYDRKASISAENKGALKIKSLLTSEAPLGKIVVKINKTDSRKARQAELTLYAKEVYLSCPAAQLHKKNLSRPKVNAIYCIEQTPRSDNAPIEWLLFTDLPTRTFEEVCEKLKWYCCRWQIEIFFKVLKSGCKIEKLQLTDKNFSVCLAFYMIVAWRILYLTIIGRHHPDSSCEFAFSKAEWEAAYIVKYKKPPPSTPPRLESMINMVAGFGGYLHPKSGSPPGVKSLWLGLRAMQEHIMAIEAFKLTLGGALMGNDKVAG